MAELEKLKVVEASYNAFNNLNQQLKDYLKNLSKQFGLIDPGADVSADVGAHSSSALI